MKKRLSIGFFTAALAAFIALAAAYHFTYERAVERAREEVALSVRDEEETETEQSGQAVTTEGDAFKEDAYYLMEVNGYVVVFLSDKRTAYEYTSIEVSSLPATLQNEIKNGKYIESTELLYSFLENYTS
ncbi:hypothetical protein [Lachnoclostridium sp. An118]|uniref:hypothetical protein n=1 Tax=Lachnoclostridium sp. An118 TaxID=1965547 RepID=UPI000B37AF09|nr:hypothetical protein [Lachnoclostridium sp. An118]OUQ50736.1 hypothetical protein B5E62_06895 [Lachnoclostridium sp. An118]